MTGVPKSGVFWVLTPPPHFLEAPKNRREGGREANGVKKHELKGKSTK